MPKKLDDRVRDILKKLEFDPKECLWETHDQWVMYHRYVEIAGAKNGIWYNLFDVENNSTEGFVAVKCTAFMLKETPTENGKEMKQISITTYGEASPKNYKSSPKQPYYPYAMAEKRAVDRAILKLIGLHGFIYSEDEMDHTNTKEEKVHVPNVKEQAYLDMSDDEKELINDNAEEIKRLYLTGDKDKKTSAFNDFYKDKSNEYKLALWHVLSRQSEIRRDLKQRDDFYLNGGGDGR